MTYKELIQASLEKIVGEEYEIEIDGKKRTVTEPTIRSIAFEHLLINMSAIILNLVDKVIRQPHPSATIGDDHFSGDAVENPQFDDYMRAMVAGNLFVNYEIFNELRTFMDWLLEQEEPSCDEDSFNLWYEFKTLAEKWNNPDRLSR